MLDEFYIAVGGETKGPYTLPQLKSMWDQGLITSDTQYWRAGMDDWYIITNLFETVEDKPATLSSASTTKSSTNIKREVGNNLRQVIATKGNRIVDDEEAGRNGGSLGISIIFLLIIASAAWHYIAPGSMRRIIDRGSSSLHEKLQSIQGQDADSSDEISDKSFQRQKAASTDKDILKKEEFPVGSYKYNETTYIVLNPDGTFTVTSGDNILWSCRGKWSFSGTTLFMRADVDKERQQFIPYILYLPAGLVSNGKNAAVWECASTTFEWQKL